MATTVDTPSSISTPGPERPRAGRGSSWLLRRRTAPYLFLVPFFVIFGVFGIFPIAYSLYLSFFQGFGFTGLTFVGLDNYAYMLGDPQYLRAVLNTTYYMMGSVFLLSPLALGLALLFRSRFLAVKTLFKVIFFMPVITSSVVISVIFLQVFDTNFGLLNAMLGTFGVEVGWITDPRVVMPSMILMGIWTYLGLNSLYWLAGLAAINQDYYDAATVDGANALQTFRYVTLPLLRPVALFVVIQAIVGSYNLFAQPLLMTEGGPADASLTLSLYLYQQGFRYFNIGYASAIAYSMFAVLLVLSIVNIMLFRGYRTSE
ncbi:carbohydrate ABC transporter permease [Pseudonocardia sichuanensis]|uniref:Carbohydrate ABC transporter membrane protein 1 (CUT1 family) n=1 Tax=Pseudonocardia kunmingensis TaxID=630975 RepID=A0A543DQR7_9PSEU|nr:sugar ABC transporter permease [Pseudonocardia kunmingensis]TQM11667.1 carbohydrate ABC transporter membrane protein 1 (CUT1 family) [Pseudonocardia kunmingensis]